MIWLYFTSNVSYFPVKLIFKLATLSGLTRFNQATTWQPHRTPRAASHNATGSVTQRHGLGWPAFLSGSDPMIVFKHIQTGSNTFQPPLVLTGSFSALLNRLLHLIVKQLNYSPLTNRYSYLTRSTFRLCVLVITPHEALKRFYQRT